MKNNNKHTSENLAGRYYDVKDYAGKDQISSGLAITHEQVSDVYAEGQVNPVIEDINGKNIELPTEE